jgi:hypothetical protein
MDYAYHVTYVKNLAGIAQKGLGVGRRSGMSLPGYAGHSLRKLFFSEYEDIGEWYFHAEAFAESETDNILLDEFIPVVVAFPWPDIYEQDEASDKGFYAWTPVPADKIKLWDGSKWKPIRKAGPIDVQQALDHEIEDGQALVWFRQQSDNPLANPEEL